MGDARGLSATAAARPASRLHPRRRRRGCRDRVSARRGGNARCGPPASAGAAEQLHPGRGDRGLLRRCDQHPYQPDPGGGARRVDTIAVDSMEVLLRPLGIEVPPALVWMDKGTGAAILRAGVRLWGPGGPSPVAAIKLTRHNLGHPTALLHETGHQVAHLTGWTDELGDALLEELSPQSPEVAELWRS